MKLETFKKGVELQERIAQLRLTKSYLDSLFKNKAFTLKVGIEAFNEKAKVIFPGLCQTDISAPEKDNEDYKYILDSVESRITLLQIAFNELED